MNEEDYLKPIKAEDYPGQKCTLGVKFSNDIILLESFLKQMNIAYDPSELEQTPFGLGHRIKRDSK